MGATSWDANVFLCLGAWGLPDDVVKRMMKMTKKTHEEFSLGEARMFWLSNVARPTLVKTTDTRVLRVQPRLMQFCIPHAQRLRSDWTSSILKTWQNHIAMTIEFKGEWRLRSVEDRKKKVVEWCNFGNGYEQRRRAAMSQRGNTGPGRFRGIMECAGGPVVPNEYTNNLWRSWEAWSYCEDPLQIMNESNTRQYVSEWYEGIHPGRFFLFYRENKIIEDYRNRAAVAREAARGPCEDGYVFPKTPIFSWGPYEQLIEDLRCIDGPGLGEKSGKTIDHIDDLFI